MGSLLIRGNHALSASDDKKSLFVWVGCRDAAVMLFFQNARSQPQSLSSDGLSLPSSAIALCAVSARSGNKKSRRRNVRCIFRLMFVPTACPRGRHAECWYAVDVDSPEGLSQRCWSSSEWHDLPRASKTARCQRSAYYSIVSRSSRALLQKLVSSIDKQHLRLPNQDNDVMRSWYDVCVESISAEPKTRRNGLWQR